MGQKNSKTSRNLSDTNGSAEIKQTAAIFKLNIDCFEEIFDYLPIEDLVSVGKTCKRLQQVAGCCFQQNYSGRAFCDSSLHTYRYGQCDVELFALFICKIMVGFQNFRNFFNTRSKLHQLKQIDIHRLTKADRTRFMKISMDKLEGLRFGVECDLGKNLQEILTRCTNLRHLDLSGCKTDYNWLNQKCPTLEYFKFTGNMPSCTTWFLELNPNIKKFAINSLSFLWKIRNQMMATNVKLNELAVYICSEDVSTLAKLKSMCDLFNELHKRGFYRKLKLKLSVEHQEQIDQLTSLKGLVEIDISFWEKGKLASLKNLEEIRVFAADMIGDIETLANELINLRRIHFFSANISDILPFVRRSVELRRIVVCSLGNGIYFNKDTNVIDLLALHRERKQLPDAQKITLYIDEKIYLATKRTDFGLIQLKRDNFEWHDEFH